MEKQIRFVLAIVCALCAMLAVAPRAEAKIQNLLTAAKLLGAAVTLSGVALAQFGSTPDRPERESPGLVE